MRDSVVMYRAQIAALLDLESVKDIKALLGAILDAGMNGTSPDVPKHLLPLWHVISDRLEADRERWERTRLARQAAGSTGGYAKAGKCQQMPANAGKVQQNVANVAVSVPVSVSNDVLDKKESTLSGTQEKPKKPTFQKPTLDEVKAYAAEKSLTLDAEAFFDHFEANGWKAGSVPMKDWQAAVRNWARNEKTFNRGQQPQVGYNRPGTEGSYGRYVGKH